MLKRRILFYLSKWIKPVMIGRYKRSDGTVLPLTRICSSTFLQGENNFHVEDNVYIGHANFIDASNGLTIEEGCQITNFVSIITHSSHDAIRLYGKKYTSTPKKLAYNEGQVKIGKYSFIGPHAVIMPGTTIGKGSLLAAYSFVKGSFPDYAIISGNPAVVVGDTRDRDSKWLADHGDLNANYQSWNEGANEE